MELDSGSHVTQKGPKWRHPTGLSRSEVVLLLRFNIIGDGPDAVSDSTVSTPSSVSFSVLTKFQGESSVTEWRDSRESVRVIRANRKFE